MKKVIIKIAVVVGVLLVVAVVASFFFLGSIVKKGVETVGPQITKTELKLDSASLSIFSGSGTLKGLLVGNPEGYKTPSSFKVGSVSVGVRPGSLFSDKIHVTHVNVQAPEITLEGGLKDNNLNKILENVQAAAGSSTNAAAPADSGASRKIQVDDLVVSGGKVSLNMVLTAGKTVTVPLPDIHVTGLGQGAEGITVADLTARVMREITKGVLKAAEKGIADLGKLGTEAVKDAGKTATESVDKAAKGVTDIFKKKKE